MVQTNTKIQTTDTELIAVLNSISILSQQLARKLTLLAATSQKTKGGKTHEQNERYVHDNRRTAHCCCRY